MTAVQPKQHRHGICEANEMVGLGDTYKVILDGVAYVLLSATIDDPREGPEVVTLTGPRTSYATQPRPCWRLPTRLLNCSLTTKTRKTDDEIDSVRR